MDLEEAARQSVAYVALVVQAVAQADRAVILVVLAAWVENAELEAFDLAEVTDKVAEVDEPAAGLAAAGLAAAGPGLKGASLLEVTA